ncbi:hypothetical protein F5X97DRAFT_112615 [Nemania serpens]|nr:hypothetical protein F5X97DRAFT_112615 [Nemania serpens]
MIDTRPAENANYVTAALTLSVLITRISLSIWRRERIDTSIILVVASIVVVVGRTVATIYYLRFGNAADAIKHAHYYKMSESDNVKAGGILILVARVLMTTILWLQDCLLLLLYSRIIYGVKWAALVVKTTWVTAAVTYVAVILVTFLECRPIYLYWQITPYPGHCLQAYAQLLTQTVSNIILDIMLIGVAWPLVGLKKRTVAEHITLYTLFALGTFAIVVSIIRIVTVQYSGSSQVTRSLWASVQMVVATFLANAPSIYGSIRRLRSKGLEPTTTNNSAPAAPRSRGLDAAGNSRGVRGAWSRLLIYDTDSIALTSSSPAHHHHFRPLPPATAFYDPQTAPAPYSHQASLEEGMGPCGGSIELDPMNIPPAVQSCVF